MVFERRPQGQGRPDEIGVALVLDGQPVSTCVIYPLTLRIGVATVRIGGIGFVGTLPEHRGRGYARRMLNSALAHMAAGDIALSMLYGIPHFYEGLGYTTAGPEYTLEVPLTGPALHRPAGWQVRPARPADLAAIQRLYDHGTACAVGAAVRSPGLYPWTELARLSPDDLAGECRVAVAPSGEVAAYAWALGESWFVQHLASAHPRSMVLAEVVARDAAAADSILAACREWALEEAQARAQPLVAALLSLPPEGPVAAAAMQGAVTFQQTYSATGEWMVRVVHAGRLLAALAPELELRLRAALPTFRGTLRLETDVGDVALHASPDGLTVSDGTRGASGDRPVGGHYGVRGDRAAATAGEALVVRLPQTTLARLALGAFCPADLLARLEGPPAGPALAVLEALFPPRHPHLSLPDRF